MPMGLRGGIEGDDRGRRGLRIEVMNGNSRVCKKALVCLKEIEQRTYTMSQSWH